MQTQHVMVLMSNATLILVVGILYNMFSTFKHKTYKMSMIRPGLSFANVAGKTNPSIEISKYAPLVNESIAQYAYRLKNVIADDTTGTGPYPVFIISYKSTVMRIAARNEHVARFLANHIVKNTHTKSVHASEQTYIAFAMSDEEEGFRIGLSDDMNVAESIEFARYYYRANEKYKLPAPLNWFKATSAQTSETMESEGPIF
jgi:hypothetical protein